VCAATRKACDCTFDPAHAGKIAPTIWTFVEIAPRAFVNRESQIVTPLLTAYSQIAARNAPLVSMRPNSATTSAKLSENMCHFVAQCAIDFGRMFEQP
jgi:hypothetical protein